MDAVDAHHPVEVGDRPPLGVEDVQRPVGGVEVAQGATEVEASEALPEPLGDAEDAAVPADVLAEDDDAIVLLRSARNQSADWTPFLLSLALAALLGLCLAAGVAFLLARAVARPVKLFSNRRPQLFFQPCRCRTCPSAPCQQFHRDE